MKKLITVLLILSTGFAFAQTVVKFGQVSKTVAAADPPETITATNLYCKTATFVGKKAARTANVGTVYLGPTTNNDAQAYTILPLGEVVITAPEGQVFNLKEWSLDVENAGDGVIVLYAR